MSLHFHREIDRLKKKLLALSAIVEEDLAIALRSIRERDVELARRVIHTDADIDEMEIDVEEDCLKILALYHPVASDLRFIISVLKMNNELERIGDLAKNISKRAISLAGSGANQIPPQIDMLGQRALTMLKKALDALITLDVELAREVCDLDDEVDALNKEMFRLVRDRLRAAETNVDADLQIMLTARYLERIADHVTNIAEDVVYLAGGEIIRHKGKDWGVGSRE